jgi:benzoyl-CoA reductase/2-hydroxyglutaryl-CoA dehydratase subunit BcrC/BadD/HgdB
MVCSLVPMENNKDGCIHNMETSNKNYEMEFPILGKKLNSFLN